MPREDKGELTRRIAQSSGVDSAKVAGVVQLALEELHRISVIDETGPTAAVVEACCSFGAEVALLLIGLYAVEQQYHGRHDQADAWREVAQRLLPAAYREGCDRVAPWFEERTVARRELDTAVRTKLDKF